MTPDGKILLGIAAGAGVGIGLFWWLHRNDVDSQDGSIIDQLGDAFVSLTTKDETRLSQMQPDAQAATRALIADLSGQGIGVYVGQTLRTSAQEKAVIDADRSAVTSVSWHQLGRAVDLYPRFDDGSADLTGNNIAAILSIARTAERYGFRQLGFNADDSKRIIHTASGKGIWDSGHIEYRAPYGTIAEAVELEGAAFGLA